MQLGDDTLKAFSFSTCKALGKAFRELSWTLLSEDYRDLNAGSSRQMIVREVLGKT